ncbi:uncharacterized protein LOC131382433 [Hylobates moloch]|uniref:uncharacterized protein LOC131382433 n=1 Tax=Hylobates moloch TaxID=81572 RepID=UPI002674F34A|nr:uncharacterized protein LOC131382433 [Hylobates moloch]
MATGAPGAGPQNYAPRRRAGSCPARSRALVTRGTGHAQAHSRAVHRPGPEAPRIIPPSGTPGPPVSLGVFSQRESSTRLAHLHISNAALRPVLLTGDSGASALLGVGAASLLRVLIVKLRELSELSPPSVLVYQLRKRRPREALQRAGTHTPGGDKCGLGYLGPKSWPPAPSCLPLTFPGRGPRKLRPQGPCAPYCSRALSTISGIGAPQRESICPDWLFAPPLKPAPSSKS